MSVVTEAIDLIVKGEVESFLIPCGNKHNQESVRVMCFNQKRKIPKELRERIGIKKEEVNGELYIKLHKKPRLELYIQDKEGKIVLYKPSKQHDPELQRILQKMKEDGIGEEERERFAEEW